MELLFATDDGAKSDDGKVEQYREVVVRRQSFLLHILPKSGEAGRARSAIATYCFRIGVHVYEARAPLTPISGKSATLVGSVIWACTRDN